MDLHWASLFHTVTMYIEHLGRGHPPWVAVCLRQSPPPDLLICITVEGTGVGSFGPFMG